MGFKAYPDCAQTHGTVTDALKTSMQTSDGTVIVLDVSALFAPHLYPLGLNVDKRQEATPMMIARSLLENASDALVGTEVARAGIVVACDRAPKPPFKLRHAKMKPLEWPEGFDPLAVPPHIPLVPPGDQPRAVDQGIPVLQQPGPDDDLIEWVMHPTIRWPASTFAQAPTLWELAIKTPVVRQLVTRAVMCAAHTLLTDNGDELPSISSFFDIAFVTIPEVQRQSSRTAKRPAQDAHPTDAIERMTANTLRTLAWRPPVRLKQVPASTPARAGVYGHVNGTPVCLTDDSLFRGEADVSGPRLAHLVCKLFENDGARRTTVVVRTTDSDAVVTAVLQTAVMGDAWPADRFVQLRKKGGEWKTKQVRLGPAHASFACSWTAAAAMLGADFIDKQACRLTSLRGNGVFLDNAKRWLLAHPASQHPLVPATHHPSGMPMIKFDKEAYAKMFTAAQQSSRQPSAKRKFPSTPEQHALHAFRVVQYYTIIPSAAPALAAGLRQTPLVHRTQPHALLCSRLTFAPATRSAARRASSPTADASPS